MREKVSCNGKIAVQFNYSETGDKNSKTVKDREELINMFLMGAEEALEDMGLTIQKIDMLDFDYTSVGIGCITENV